MRDYTTDNPVFSDKISIVEQTDLVNARNKTKSEKQLLQNDLVLRARLKQCLGDDPEHGDSQNLIVTFDSGDSETVNKWTDTETIHSGEEHKNLMAKVSTMVKNVRYLYKLLGTTDISKIGDGTVTGAIKKVNKALKPIDTENRVENMTSINQITSTGFWKISAIDSNYASSIGIDNNTGDFYAIVSNYTGNGTDHFDFGDLLLFSPRLKGYHYAVDVWNGDARARLVLTNDNILTTKEQINANTDTRNVAGATAMKEMFGEINSNLTAKVVDFTAKTENTENSSCVAEFIEFQNDVLFSIYGAIRIEKALVRGDILGTFSLPFNIDVSFSAYIDKVTADKIQPMVVTTLRPNGNLITRTSLSAGDWVGFLGCTLVRKVNN